MNRKLTSAQHARARLEAILRIDNSPKDHQNCKFSIGICGSLTVGQVGPDFNGYFEVPCRVCEYRILRRSHVVA